MKERARINLNSGLFAVNYAIRKVARWIKPVGRIPAAIVCQVIVTPIHQHDGIGPEPPIPGMGSDAEMHVAPIADSTMESEALVGLSSATKHGGAP